MEHVNQQNHLFINGRRPPKLRMAYIPPNRQHGPRRSATECDRKQGRSKPTVHTRRERRNGERSTCREKVKEISLQKGMSFWKTKKSGEMKLPFTEPYTNPENERDPTKTGYSCHIKKDQSHPHSLPTGSFGRDRDESCWENG